MTVEIIEVPKDFNRCYELQEFCKTHGITKYLIKVVNLSTKTKSPEPSFFCRMINLRTERSYTRNLRLQRINNMIRTVDGDYFDALYTVFKERI